MMLSPPLPAEEMSRRGNEWYEKIRPTIETPENIGKQITINVLTGEYEIHGHGDAIAVCARLFESDLYAPLFGFRIGQNGHEAVYSLGFGSTWTLKK